MNGWMRRLSFLMCGLLLTATVVGCAEREHRKMQVREEQRQGEVEEVPPGEMIVE